MIDSHLYRILQLASNSPRSSSGRNSSTAVSPNLLTTVWPAWSEVSRMNSDSSARPCRGRGRREGGVEGEGIEKRAEGDGGERGKTEERGGSGREGRERRGEGEGKQRREERDESGATMQTCHCAFTLRRHGKTSARKGVNLSPKAMGR